MKILTNKNRVARVVFMVSLNCSHNDESILYIKFNLYGIDLCLIMLYNKMEV